MLAFFNRRETPSKKAAISDFIPAISGDTVIVVFNDTTCYYKDWIDNVYFNDKKSYSGQKIGDRHYRFYFIIDSLLLGQAIRCSH